MKLKNILILTVIGVSVAGYTSCNYLDYEESVGTDKDLLYSYMSTAEAMLTPAYLYLYTDFGNLGGATLDCATDDAMWYQSDTDVRKFEDGSWSPTSTVDDRWSTSYTAIRVLNDFMDTFDQESFDRFEYNQDYDEYMSKFQYFHYEARVLRAMYLFDLAKRYGAIPMPLTVLTADEANEIERTPLADVIDFIVSECTECAESLPVVPEVNDTGRVSKGVALALKSRALLFWASPLCNSEGETDRWVAAAVAAKEVIDMNQYRLQPYSEADNLNNITTSEELIFAFQNYIGCVYEQRNTAIGIDGGSTGICPSQDLVDAFQTVNGYEVTLGDRGFTSTDTAFDSSNPYSNRDPRFYRTIMYNGTTWNTNDELYTIETYTGGNNAQPKQGATTTGYYIKKYMVEYQRISTNTTSLQHYWVIFRYAEMVLNYAEAMYEAYGKTGTDNDKGLTLSSLDAIKMVRDRAGVSNALLDAVSESDFQATIHNERRVEFALEGMRFWDLRRWLKGDEFETLSGVTITLSGSTYSYAPTTATTRVWYNRMYWYPIPQNEIYKNSNLTQNDNW